MPNGRLSFAPLYACPFSLPFGMLNTEGSLSCDGAGKVTLALAFGRLALPAGGLSVSGRAFPGAVSLRGGENVTW